MTQRDALLAAVYASPHEDLPRLVFADWLDENGEPERAFFIRFQIERAKFAPDDPKAPHETSVRDHLMNPAALLEPIDRDAFELVSYRPTFTRGFLSGVAFPDFGASQYDPPIYPHEEVGDDWARVCDLIERNPLVNTVLCPDWFVVEVFATKSGGWRADLIFLNPQPCTMCDGDTVNGSASCMWCRGEGVRPNEEHHTDTRAQLVRVVLREQIRRSLNLPMTGASAD